MQLSCCRSRNASRRQKGVKANAMLKAVSDDAFCKSNERNSNFRRQRSNLRSLQPLGLFAANSIFVGDYLTTQGQEPTADWGLIEDLGFEIEECAL